MGWLLNVKKKTDMSAKVGAGSLCVLEISLREQVTAIL
jgi:hypothetical protein